MLLKVNSKLLGCPAHARGRNAYVSWMGNSEDNVAVVIRDVADKRKLISCLEHLRVCESIIMFYFHYNLLPIILICLYRPS